MQYLCPTLLPYVFTIKEALFSLREGFRPGIHLYPTDVLSWHIDTPSASLQLSGVSKKRFYTLVKHLNFYGCHQKTPLYCLALVGQ